MTTIKINSEIKEQIWKDLKMLIKESYQNVSDLLTKAISDYIHRQHMKSVVLDQLAGPMNNNNKLGKSLTK